MTSPAVPVPSSKTSSQDQKVKAAIHFVEPLSPPGMAGHRKPPRLGQGRTSRSGRPSELKVPKDRQQGGSRSKTPTPSMEGLPHPRPFPPGHSPITPDTGADRAAESSGHPPEKGLLDGYRLHDESNQRAFILSSSKDSNVIAEQMGLSEVLDASVQEAELLRTKEVASTEEPLRSKASLIEVDLAHLKAPDEDGEVAGPDSASELVSDGDQKPGVGFFFKVRGRS